MTTFEEWLKQKKRKEASVTDIAPVKEQEKNWFESGAFKDGYQVGDVTKTILGTAGDVLEDAGAGILGMGETTLDTLMFLSPFAADPKYYQTGGVYHPREIQEIEHDRLDEIKRGNAAFVAQDLYDAEKIAKKIVSAPIKSIAGYDIEDLSVFGSKMDSIAQSGGQLLATAGLQAVGVPWFLTTGATSFGSEVENALNQGATMEEAGLSALISAGAEILTEKLSGGISFGGKTLDDVLTRRIASSVSNKLVRNGGKVLLDMVGEGGEEVVSSIFSNLGSSLYKDKNIKELLTSEEAMDEYIDSFLGGAILGGVSSTGKAVSSKVKGEDYVSGLTKNEKAVFDKVYNDAIAEKEADGTKLSQKEKTKIYDETMNALEKGYIDIDTIESTLGGEAYDNYKTVTEQESALKKEIETLENLPKEQITVKQSERLAEARKQLEEIDLETPKNELSLTVSELVKGDRLGESYNEKARRSQVFEAELTKYDAKQREVVQKAVESGILNNTNKTHEFVDMLAKLSADKGVSFDFTNNQKLRDSGFALEGKTVNGFVKDGNISLNVESVKVLNAVVGHEITHVLEGTELYGELQQAVKMYAESKGEYGKRLEVLQKLYAGVEGANIENELTADLIGDYLFTDSDFVNRLSTEKPGLFKRIFEEIKYLVKTATAGSKQARELEKVKRAFEKAYRENGSATTDEVKYSMQRDNKGKEYWKIDTHKDIFKGLQTTKEIEEAAFEYILQQRDGNVVVDAIDGKKMSFIRISAEEFTNSEESQALKKNDPVAFAQKMRLIPSLEDLAGNASVNWWSPDLKNHNLFKERGFENFRGRVGIDNVIFNYVIRSGKARFGDVFYDINLEVDQILPHTNGASEIKRSTSDNSIPQIEENATTSSKINVLTDEGLTMTYVRVPNQNTQNYGSTYGQNIEPAGEYMSMDTMQGQHKIEGYEYGTIQFKNPLVLEHISTSDTGWKKTVSDMYNGLTGKKLTNALIKDGYDTIVTYDEYGYSEIVNLNGTKLNGNSDVTRSLSKDTQDIAPMGNYNVRGKDIALDLPIREDHAKTIEVAPVQQEVGKDHSKADRIEKRVLEINRQLEQDKANLTEEFAKRREEVESSLANPNEYISRRAYELYKEISNLKKGVKASAELGYLLDYGYSWNEIKSSLMAVRNHPDGTVNQDSASESVVREMLGRELEELNYELDDLDNELEEQLKELETAAEKDRTEAGKSEQALTRSELHANIMDNISDRFAEKGYNFDDVLSEAKNLSTFRTVDNTPQRVMEKALGYKEGQILSDLTVNQVAQNETEGIKWLNSFTDRKNGFLAQISKQYGIKSHSKESAAAQMYAEGFWVNDKNEIVKYGDRELALDFPDAKVRENIKALAHDPRIRQVYDETLKSINEARTRNAYPEIPRLENYFLHFRAMHDTFSRLGLPFNPMDIRAKDLPTDLNGVTADLKPGKPYFGSEQHRKGKRTDFDLLGGLEQYLTAAKNQIYHIDDIQTLRALRNHIAERYGRASGLENLDSISEEELQERISQVYGSHLSTFAKFLNEEANILAGKTSLIDRGLEGIIGRRGITFLNDVNKQVGTNMVGFNVSSAGTNFLSIVQALGKTKKTDAIKALAQMASNKVSAAFGGHTDGFAENSPVVIRRKGAERFYRTPWQIGTDLSYALMGAVDNISTELIARTKYNELTRKGMDSGKAHLETDKWVSRLMGDRSLGQMPQLYNSKMLGLITKFQLEVRNQLDSQFYDTIQDAKVSTEYIEDNLKRNAVKAAKIGATFVQLAVLQHLFGKAYESIAGYNPAFDIIESIITMFGWDDEEESEDTAMDNLEQGMLALLEDMPYSSLFMDGGRIPISSALPIRQVVSGVDKYGNEKPRLETLAETVPYYVFPAGYGQIKKTAQGLKMFDDDLPIAGSYTDSGKLRFSVEDTPANRLQAAVFGQWASENARKYFDEGRSALTEKQTQELADLDLPMSDYWKYRDGLKEQSTVGDKIDYIASLDLPIDKKNIMVNNVTERNKPIDLTGYEQYSGYEEFNFATNTNPELYAFLKENDVSYDEYAVLDEDGKEAYKWAHQNPEKYRLSQAIERDVVVYRKIIKALNAISADKDQNGKTIADSRKKKVSAYINKLDIDYGQKLILFKSEYPSDDTFNYEIIDYLNNRDDITYEDMEAILKELGFTVTADGGIQW